MSTIELIETYLLDINCPYFLILEAINSINYNTGFSYSNFNLKTTILYISKQKSIGEFLNTLSHECQHIMSHMNKIYNFNFEERAMIVGILVLNIFENLFLVK